MTSNHQHPETVPVTPPGSGRFSVKAILLVVGLIEVMVWLSIWLLRH